MAQGAAVVTRVGGPKQPYTTAVMADGQLHFIRLVMGHGRYRSSCGREGSVEKLKDRLAADLLDLGPLPCPRCFTVAWQYHLLREAKR